MISEFIYKYYIDPIRYSQPYTLVDTLTYAIILIGAVYLVYRWLNHAGIPVDEKLVLSTIPFVVFGGLLRVVEDTGMITSDVRFLLVTPLIFFVVFFITVIALVISHHLSQRGRISEFTTVYAAIGIGLVVGCVAVLASYGLRFSTIGFVELSVILSLASVTSLVLWAGIRYLFRWTYVSSPLYSLLIFGHMLDASATSYGIDLHTISYYEVHVVGSAIISLTGTGFSMFLLKLAVIIPAIYILEGYKKEGNRELWYVVVLCMIVLGLAPGTRDMGRMVLYV
ncbi:MAG: DUF63 family protein [Methanomicrobiales archaeon]|nr:DUF63 family protein [Methanomicrobiales archaeon]